MNQTVIEKYLTSLGDITSEKLTDEGTILFKMEDRLVAVLELSDPLRISLRCESELANLLREKYETVMPGQKLNHKHWNTIVLTGQIEWPEIQGFIRLSYDLTKDQLN
jgi:predicted DNA-binding protein (MmcQ/YjbR family)